MKKIGIGLFFIISATSFGKITPGNSLISLRGQVTYNNEFGQENTIKSNNIGINIRVAMGVSLEMSSGIGYAGVQGNKVTYGFYIKVKNIGNIEDIFQIYMERNGLQTYIGDTKLLHPEEMDELYISGEGLENISENYEIKGYSLRNPYITGILKGDLKFPDLNYIPSQSEIDYQQKRKFYIFNLDRTGTNITYNEQGPKIQFRKYQGIGYKGNVNMDIPYTITNLEGHSGDRVFYKLELINNEDSYIRDVTIKDSIPFYTKMSYGDYSISPKGVPCYRIVNRENFTKIPVVPLEGTQGDISITIPQVNSKETLELYFNVKID